MKMVALVLTSIVSATGCISLASQQCNTTIIKSCEFRAQMCGERDIELCKETLDTELQCTEQMRVDPVVYHQCLADVAKTEQCLVVLPESCRQAFHVEQ